MSDITAVAVIQVFPGTRHARHLETARGRTVLERVASVAASVPGVRAVAVLTPDNGSAMSLGRSFKNKIQAEFLAWRGGRMITACKYFLHRHRADFLLTVQGGNLLVTRDMARAVLDTAVEHSRHCWFDMAGNGAGEHSVFGRVDAVPTPLAKQAAGLSEAGLQDPVRRLGDLCRLCDAPAMQRLPSPRERDALFKLNFDNRLFSCTRLHVELVHKSAKHKSRDPALFMDPELFKNICRELSGPGRTFTLRLGHGADPLLHPDITALIRYAADMGLRTQLHTPALRLTAERAAALCDSGLHTLAVPLDAADEDTYFHLHGMPLGAVEDNMRRFLALRTEYGNAPRLFTTFTLSELNRGQARNFFTKWNGTADRVVFREQRDATGRLSRRHAIDTGAQRHPCERPLRSPLLTLGGDILMCPVAGSHKFLNCGSVHERGVFGALTHDGTRTIYSRKPAAWRGKPCSTCDLWRFESFSHHVTRTMIQSFNQSL